MSDYLDHHRPTSGCRPPFYHSENCQCEWRLHEPPPPPQEQPQAEPGEWSITEGETCNLLDSDGSVLMSTLARPEGIKYRDAHNAALTASQEQLAQARLELAAALGVIATALKFLPGCVPELPHERRLGVIVAMEELAKPSRAVLDQLRREATQPLVDALEQIRGTGGSSNSLRSWSKCLQIAEATLKPFSAQKETT